MNVTIQNDDEDITHRVMTVASGSDYEPDVTDIEPGDEETFSVTSGVRLIIEEVERD